MNFYLCKFAHLYKFDKINSNTVDSNVYTITLKFIYIYTDVYKSRNYKLLDNNNIVFYFLFRRERERESEGEINYETKNSL